METPVGTAGSEVERLRALHPNEPWLWKRSWADGRIYDEAPRTWLGHWFFVCVWGFLLYFVWQVRSADILAKVKESPLLLVPLSVFPLIGLAVLYAALQATWRRFTWGKPCFVMHSVPGIVGGTLSGTIETPLRKRPEKGLRLLLSCIRETTELVPDRRGHLRHNVEDEVLWKKEHRISAERLEFGSTGTIGVPVLFEIPDDAQESDHRPQPDSRIYWQLAAIAKDGGRKREYSFVVPVFKTWRAETPSRT